MKHRVLIIAFMLTSFGDAAAGPRSREWQHNLHTVGETYPNPSTVRRLLGQPDHIGEITVLDSSHYAPFQPLVCARPKPGTILSVWRYCGTKEAFLVYFQANDMVCYTADLRGLECGS